MAYNRGSNESVYTRVAMSDKSCSDLKLWYRQSASRWLEALPIGNGRIGAMVYGGAEHERIALNEVTLWSGRSSDEHENPNAGAKLPEIRQLLFDGKYAEAKQSVQDNVLGSQRNFGTNLPLGDLSIDMECGHPVQNYRRELDIADAVSRVTYTSDNVRFSREYIASNVDQVVAIRITADTVGKLSFALRFDSDLGDYRVQADPSGQLRISGHAYEAMHSDGHSGVAFNAIVQIVHDGGSITASEDVVTVVQASAVTILIAVNTDYLGDDPAVVSLGQIDAAVSKGYGRLREDHIDDYQSLFGRVHIDLGASTLKELPTDERQQALLQGRDDPAFAALLFQYGRYLTIAGSRANSPLPLHLQGIWNDNVACKMSWTCDYHLDINTQQNYWAANVGNLSECSVPLFSLVDSLRAPGRRTAQKMYGCGGWVCHVYTNAWGFTAPGNGLGWGTHDVGGAWIASHLWDHYAFTGDETFLSETAYPILKESAQFFLESMVEHPDQGYLMTGPAVSPENWFIAPDGTHMSESMMPVHDRVVVHEIFTRTIQAGHVLCVDAPYRAELQTALKKLPPLTIGKHGQIQEWHNDYEEAVPNHRHTSHLCALYPFSQITRRTHPELADAARVSIEHKMDRPDFEDVEWSRANAINYYARLGDGERAHESVRLMLTKLCDKNLMSMSLSGIAGAGENIYSFDGNPATTAGIAEMLLQSIDGILDLLPALPRAWSSGEVRGLRARGGFTVDVTWDDMRLAEAIVRADQNTHCRIYTERPLRVSSPEGELNLQPDAGLCKFPVAAGVGYRISY